MILFLRSTLFNFAFYGATALACLICLPGLLLPHRKAMIIVRCFVKSVYFLERRILKLDYEVRGAENIPEKGSFIVAAKHQSPYETLKLHILFDFPAIVLKKELLKIPLWGWFLARSEPIAIDRANGRQASAQIIEGAKRIEKQNRPIVIFPQGTRVYPWQTPEEKPYKNGIIRMYEATSMPIVPLALNSGIFWPRRSWIKKPGKVIFQFLPPVMPGTDTSGLLKTLETSIETATKALEAEAEKKESP